MTLPPTVNFLGDSVSAQLLTLSRWFGAGAAAWVNAGVGGDTSQTMLARVNTDVNPAVSATCLVQVGLNDLNTGAGSGGANPDIIPPGTAANGFTSLGGFIALIIANLVSRGITPMLGNILNLHPSYPNAAALNAGIAILNPWLKTFAAARYIPFADYNRAFLDANGNSRIELFIPDNGHPNANGQVIYTAVAAATLITGISGAPPAWVREMIVRDFPTSSGETVIGFAAWVTTAMQRRNYTFRVGSPGYTGIGMTDDQLDALARTALGF